MPGSIPIDDGHVMSSLRAVVRCGQANDATTDDKDGFLSHDLFCDFHSTILRVILKPKALGLL